MKNQSREHLENLEALLKRAEQIPSEKQQGVPQKHHSNTNEQGIKIYMETMYGKSYHFEATISPHRGKVTVYQDGTPFTTYTIEEQNKTFLMIPYTAHSFSVKEEDTHYDSRLTGAAYRSLYSRMRLLVTKFHSIVQQREMPNFSPSSIIKRLLASPWKVK